MTQKDAKLYVRVPSEMKQALEDAKANYAEYIRRLIRQDVQSDDSELSKLNDHEQALDRSSQLLEVMNAVNQFKNRIDGQSAQAVRMKAERFIDVLETKKPLVDQDDHELLNFIDYQIDKIRDLAEDYDPRWESMNEPQ